MQTLSKAVKEALRAAEKQGMKNRTLQSKAYFGKYTAHAAGARALVDFRSGRERQRRYPPGSYGESTYARVFDLVELEVLIYGEEIW